MDGSLSCPHPFLNIDSVIDSIFSFDVVFVEGKGLLIARFIFWIFIHRRLFFLLGSNQDSQALLVSALERYCKSKCFNVVAVSGCIELLSMYACPCFFDIILRFA